MSDDEKDYGFEYSEDALSEPDVEIENQYYLGKAIKEDNPNVALSSFQKVLDLQGESKGEWGFKALEQIVKIKFSLKNYAETISTYKELLTYIKQSVTKNQGEKSINSILDYISSSKDTEVLQDFYRTTLEELKHVKNDRLLFKTNTELAKLYLKRGEFNKLSYIIEKLFGCCQADEDTVLQDKRRLEIYTLEIQKCNEQKNDKRLKEFYIRSLKVRSAFPHPLIMSVIRECGGKMYLRSGEYKNAYTDFFQAFKNYDKSDDARRTTCLKYLILTSFFMKSTINPLDSQEAKPYKNNPEIQTIINLINAYQNTDLKQFEIIYKENKTTLLADSFIREIIEYLSKNVRTQGLLTLIKPYRTMTLPFISKELNISSYDTENLIVFCILDGLIRGRIDQVNQMLVMNPKKNDSECARYLAVQKLTTKIGDINEILTNAIG